MITDPQNRLALPSISQIAGQGHWRTETMRSHKTPLLIFVTRVQGRIKIFILTNGYSANNLIYIPGRTMYWFKVNQTVFGVIRTVPTAIATEWPSNSLYLRLLYIIAQKELAGQMEALERELKSTQLGHYRAAHYQVGLLSVYIERQVALRPE